MLEKEKEADSATNSNNKDNIIIKKDNTTKKKIIEIIEHQFDLEIYLKYREIATIKKEIENAEVALHDLELSIKNESIAATLPEQPHFTRQTAAALYYGQSGSSLAASTKRKLPKTVSPPSIVYGRRSDGVFVRLACPVCHRENFSNQLGFLNHCRISHSLEFGPYENVMIQCGTPIDESEVPDDHPIRQRPLQTPIVPVVSTPKKIIERPTIKEYEEDIDLELDQSGSKTKRIKLSSSRSPSPISSTSPISSSSPLSLPLPPLPPLPSTTNDTSTLTNKDNPPLSSLPPCSSSSPTPSTMKITTEKETTIIDAISVTKIAETGTGTKIKETETETVTITSNNDNNVNNDDLKKDNININNNGNDNKSNNDNKNYDNNNSNSNETSNNIPSSVEDTKTAVITSAIEDKGSRFYIKRRIIVGNVSKFIPPEKRDPTLKNYSHKWMIYVMEPKSDTKQENQPFLTAVRFHLHPSYKPYDIVDVTNEPFRLTRLGWGEFPIRLQLYFVDKKRNKSLDIIHHLKLDYTLSGKQMLGIERTIDIELDRNTNFDDITGIPSTNKETTELTKEQLQLNAVKQKITLLNSILKECLPEYPIICANQSIKLPYTCARNSKIFLTWPIAKRKALEWHRGHLLRLRVQQRCRDTNDDILLTASDALTTKDVLQWCRDNGHTLLLGSTTEEKTVSQINYPINYYCKFCGLNSHLTIQCSRKPEGWKKRLISLADQQTLSNVNILFEKLGWEPSLYQQTNHMYIKGDQIEGGDEEDTIDIDVEDRKMINNTNLSITKINQQMKELSTFFKETTIESTLSLNDTKILDWVWMIVNQLQIKSVIRNEKSLSKMNDTLQKFSHHTVNTVPSTHINQQLLVGTILTQVTKIFLKKLINKANLIYKKEKMEEQNEEKMLVPYHILKAIKQTDSFDFLTNAYMGNILSEGEN